ncbi:MAG: protein-L-isoaspartate(D-aspartate) O-methyltransferase, partial [Phycisphaerae bacterium]|nr:protein-L-isoaspartate(D-aspartate) O-methyltransferase [Phycisphaerae bacterium]
EQPDADAQGSAEDKDKPSEGKPEKPKDDKADKQKRPPRPSHKHPGFKERSDERNEMVRFQIEARGVKDVKVVRALRTVPRHSFVRPRDLKRAYGDYPLPIGLGQTISQPYIVAYMTEMLKLKPGDKVLEVGTGSGYQAAICAELAQEVYTIEIIEQLGKQAKNRLKDLGYLNVQAKLGDGYFGWPKKGPFDAIIVTCAGGLVPPPLIEQLKPGGRMILPLGHPFGLQYLVLVTKDTKGVVKNRRLLPVRFVPLLRKQKESKAPTSGDKR